MSSESIKRFELGKEPVDLVYNKVWEVICMTWPEQIPEKLDRTKVVLRRLHDWKEDARNKT